MFTVLSQTSVALVNQEPSLLVLGVIWQGLHSQCLPRVVVCVASEQALKEGPLGPKSTAKHRAVTSPQDSRGQCHRTWAN